MVLAIIIFGTCVFTKHKMIMAKKGIIIPIKEKYIWFYYLIV